MYVFDTSTFLHAWRRDYPPDSFPSVWSRLEVLADKGQLLCPDEVRLELKRRSDEVYDWLEDLDGVCVEPIEPVQEKVTEIVDRWPEFVPEESFDGVWADPWVIALAQHHEATVITGEVPVGANAHKPKIPNVCEALQVPWMKLLDMIQHEGWSF